MLQSDTLCKHLENAFQFKIKDTRIQLVALAARLDNLSPLKTMMRGYSVVEDEQGNVVPSSQSLKENQAISIRMKDGRVEAKVCTIRKEGM